VRALRYAIVFSLLVTAASILISPPILRDHEGKATYASGKQVAEYQHDTGERFLTYLRVVDKHNGLVSAIATAFIAVFTVALIWVGRRQANHLDRTIRQMEKSAEIQLRPYVSPAAFNFLWLGTPHRPDFISAYQLAITWKNSGVTPALGVRTWCSYAVLDAPIQDNFPFDDLGNFNMTCIPIGPDQVINSNIEIPLSDIRRTQEDNKALYYWCWIEYSGLDGLDRHRSEKCARIFISGDPTELTNDRPRRFTAVFSERIESAFNGTDGECLHAPKTEYRRVRQS
jgi:hypothetical protein